MQLLTPPPPRASFNAKLRLGTADKGLGLARVGSLAPEAKGLC